MRMDDGNARDETQPPIQQALPTTYEQFTCDFPGNIGMSEDESLGIAFLHLNQEEADFFFQEIFVQRAYIKGGISLPFYEDQENLKEDQESRRCEKEEELKGCARDGLGIAGTFVGTRKKRRAVIVDVGANIGLFSLFCLRECCWRGGALVVALEPVPEIYHILELNIQGYETSITQNQGDNEDCTELDEQVEPSCISYAVAVGCPSAESQKAGIYGTSEATILSNRSSFEGVAAHCTVSMAAKTKTSAHDRLITASPCCTKNPTPVEEEQDGGDSWCEVMFYEHAPGESTRYPSVRKAQAQIVLAAGGSREVCDDVGSLRRVPLWSLSRVIDEANLADVDYIDLVKVRSHVFERWSNVGKKKLGKVIVG